MIKETLTSSFSRIDECELCGANVSASNRNICDDCYAITKFAYKIGDVVKYSGETWTITEQNVVNLTGDGLLLNQYCIENRGNEVRHVFEHNFETE